MDRSLITGTGGGREGLQNDRGGAGGGGGASQVLPLQKGGMRRWNKF